MERGTVFGFLLVVAGILQFVAVPGYYHSDAQLLAIGFAVLSVAVGLLFLPQSPASIRT
jgi:uncharacterized membrane protein HdeD (DUF308 family)